MLGRGAGHVNQCWGMVQGMPAPATAIIYRGWSTNPPLAPCTPGAAWLQGILDDILEAAMYRVAMRPTRQQVAKEVAEWRAAQNDALMAIGRHLTDGCVVVMGHPGTAFMLLLLPPLWLRGFCCPSSAALHIG
jgi:hypothetical protein